jgi:putative ABC transport system permease protein
MVKFHDTGINPGGPETGNIETSYGLFVITGVLKPNPGKTSLPFKLLASLSTVNALTKDSILNYPPNDWNNVWSNYTYVLMKKGKTRADLQQMLDQISDKIYPKGKDNQFAFKAVPLTSITPSDPIGNPTNTSIPRTVLFILSVLCLVVMFSACLNYTNLSVARLLTRAKEVGIRKVSGASRKQIFAQFISEAVLVSLLAMGLSLIILGPLQDLFSGLWFNRFLGITFVYTPRLYLIFIGFSVAVGCIAGLLPAIYISVFNPAHIFKSLNSIKVFERITVRKVLLVIQFCVSMIFIISTSLIYLQGNHVLNFDYGFNKDNVINIKLFKTDNYNRFASALSTNKDIVAVSACTFLPSTGNDWANVIHKADNPKDSMESNFIDIDAGCLRVWGLKLASGSNLPAIPSDKDDHYLLVNETFVQNFKLGTPGQAVGRHIIIDGKDAEIKGVVKDFQFLDLTQTMHPLMLRNRKKEFGYATVRVQRKDVQGTVAFLQDTWK